MEVTRDCRELRDEIGNLLSSSDTVTMIKLRRMRRAGHIEVIEKSYRACIIEEEGVDLLSKKSRKCSIYTTNYTNVDDSNILNYLYK